MTKTVLSFKYALIAAGCVLFIVLKSGIWVMPNIEIQYRVSQSLTANPFSDPDEQYLFLNYFSPMLFGLLGGRNLTSFILFSAAIALLFLMIFAGWFVKYHGEEVALNRYGLLTALVFPAFAIPFYWIGMDGMTLLLILAALIALQSSVWMILSAFFMLLLSFQHFELAIVGFSLLIFTLFLPLAWKDKSHIGYLYKALWAVVWLVMGKVIMTVVFHVLGIEILGDRLIFMQKYLLEFLRQWKASWPWALYAIFGMGWFLILSHFRNAWPLVVAALLTFFALLIFGDQSRVSTIITFPSLFYWVFANRKIWKNRKPIENGIVLLYIVVPFVYVWGGQPFGSMDKYDIELVKKVNRNDLKICGEVSPWTPFVSPNPASDSFFSYPATLEEGIDFSKAGYPYFVCKVRGISVREDWGRWTDEKNVKFIFREMLPEKFELHILVVSGVSQNLREPITVQVGNESREFILTGESDQEIVLNFTPGRGVSQIEIVIPYSANPAAPLNSSEVGIGLQRLWIIEP